MECKKCGESIESAANVCPKCGIVFTDSVEKQRIPTHDFDEESQSYADETNWLTTIEQFLAAHITPERAKIIFAIAAGAILLSILISWHPWRRPVRPSPYTIPVPGDSQQQPETNWIPGAR